MAPCGLDDIPLASRLVGRWRWDPVALAKSHSAASRLGAGLLARFRRGHFVDSSRAARVLKTCLLRPLSPSLQQRLQPEAKRMELWFTTMGLAGRSDWAGIPASLWWYRIGELRRAEDCASASVQDESKDSGRYATLRLIHAMASFRNGHPEEARHQLVLGKAAVQNAFLEWSTFSKGTATKGYWYDWVFAEILLGEAEQVISCSN